MSTDDVAGPDALFDHGVQLRAEGYSIRKIAETLGVHRSKVERWVKKPEFIQRMREIHGQAREVVQQKMINNADHASETIVKIAKGEIKAPVHVQLRAAERIVDTVAPQQAASSAGLPGGESPLSDEEIQRRAELIYGPMASQKEFKRARGEATDHGSEPEPEPEPQPEPEHEYANASDVPRVRVAVDDDDNFIGRR